MNDYLVTYKFVGLTREQLDKLLEEIFSEMGIIPLRVEKVEGVIYFVLELGGTGDGTAFSVLYPVFITGIFIL
ncbi:MAG: hypothetical protein ACLTZT_01055 [Butyricimonas faecalis]